MLVEFSQGNRREQFICSEEISDPVPAMVVMYRHLKERKPYDFVEFDMGYGRPFAFEIGEYQDDTVMLQLDNNRTFKERLPISYVENLFENFFRAVRESIGYPYEFPCFGWGVDEDKAEMIGDMIEQKSKEYYGGEWNGTIEDERSKAENREQRLRRKLRQRYHVLLPEGKEYLRDYNRLLYQQIPVEGWSPHRKNESFRIRTYKLAKNNTD